MKKQPQPNFEKLKVEFYNLIISNNISPNEIVFTSLVAEQIFSITVPPVRKRYEQFKKDFNVFLDRMDIRTSGKLIDEIIKLNGSLPSWMKNKQFVIDYNEHGFLDLIKK